MNIPRITPIKINTYSAVSNQKPQSGEPNTAENLQRNYDKVDYSKIAFGSIYNIKPKGIDITAETNKLLRQINELLNSKPYDTAEEDLTMKKLLEAVSQARLQAKKQGELLERLDKLKNSKTLNPQQQYEEIIKIKREFKRIQKGKLTAPKPQQTKNVDEKLDYLLLNKFKSAVTNEDFNLLKVFKEHYAELKNITSVEELKEKFPKIKIPTDPKKVVAKKMISMLTRDFFEEFDRIVEAGDIKKNTEFTGNFLQKLCYEHAEHFGVDPQKFSKLLVKDLLQELNSRYLKAKTGNGFSSFPQQTKNKFAKITQNDLKLLSVNFDDFVLFVVKKQHLEGQKLNEIVYKSGETVIPANSLKESEYKFEKVSGKIKSLINSAEIIKSAQRDYDNFDMTKLKARLNFYANRGEIGNNEVILKRIIDFDACRFTPEDITQLKKFLKELDKIQDGENTLQEGISKIRDEQIRPQGTEKLNELERETTAHKIKQQQKSAARLNTVQTNFDDAINFLYLNNLNNIANICSKYRPVNLDEKALEKANFVIELIGKAAKNKELNKAKLEANITRWDTYNYYKTNGETDEIFQKALSFAGKENGKVNIDKAGQYLVNSEIVNIYPDSLEFVRNKEVLKKIMDRVGGDKEAAVRYLCKFDLYQDLSETQKTHLADFIGIFDQKDPIDKTLLKHIVENEYINTDTKVLTSINDNGGNTTITAAIGANAKKQILGKYKYPGCLTFMTGFEQALSLTASKTGTSGIKLIGRNNNNMPYKMELKLSGHDDRLFSSKNDFFFDIFSETGLH